MVRYDCVSESLFSVHNDIMHFTCCCVYMYRSPQWSDDEQLCARNVTNEVHCFEGGLPGEATDSVEMCSCVKGYWNLRTCMNESTQHVC